MEKNSRDESSQDLSSHVRANIGFIPVLRFRRAPASPGKEEPAIWEKKPHTRFARLRSTRAEPFVLGDSTPRSRLSLAAADRDAILSFS